MYQPWIFRPSGAVYHISFTAPSFLPLRMSSLTAVSCFTCVGLGHVVGDDVGRQCASEVRTPTALPVFDMLVVVSM